MWQWYTNPGNSTNWSQGTLKQGYSLIRGSQLVEAHLTRSTQTVQGGTSVVSFHLLRQDSMLLLVSAQIYLQTVLSGQPSTRQPSSPSQAARLLSPLFLSLTTSQRMQFPISSNTCKTYQSYIFHRQLQSSELFFWNCGRPDSLKQSKKQSVQSGFSGSCLRLYAATLWKFNRWMWIGWASQRVFTMQKSQTEPIWEFSDAPISNIQWAPIMNLLSRGRLNRGRCRLTAIALSGRLERSVNGKLNVSDLMQCGSATLGSATTAAVKWFKMLGWPWPLDGLAVAQGRLKRCFKTYFASLLSQHTIQTNSMPAGRLLWKLIKMSTLSADPMLTWSNPSMGSLNMVVSVPIMVKGILC